MRLYGKTACNSLARLPAPPRLPPHAPSADLRRQPVRRGLRRQFVCRKPHPPARYLSGSSPPSPSSSFSSRYSSKAANRDTPIAPFTAFLAISAKTPLHIPALDRYIHSTFRLPLRPGTHPFFRHPPHRSAPRSSAIQSPMEYPPLLHDSLPGLLFRRRPRLSASFRDSLLTLVFPCCLTACGHALHAPHSLPMRKPKASHCGHLFFNRRPPARPRHSGPPSRSTPSACSS